MSKLSFQLGGRIEFDRVGSATIGTLAEIASALENSPSLLDYLYSSFGESLTIRRYYRAASLLVHTVADKVIVRLEAISRILARLFSGMAIPPSVSEALPLLESSSLPCAGPRRKAGPLGLHRRVPALPRLDPVDAG